MAQIDRQYKLLAETILRDGFSYTDPTRNNIELIQIPSYQLNIALSKGFPLLTTKKVFWKKVLVELLWMLSGSMELDFLHKHNVHIWDKDAENFKKNPHYLGNGVGRVYGPQWRLWAHPFYQQNPYYLDQIQMVVEALKTTPFNRRLLVTAWNPAELNMMALPPCHWSFEILPYKIGTEIVFDLKWHQRSVDVFLGLPFDIAFYAFLGKMLEAISGYTFKNLIADLSNVHFYKPHLPQVEIQLSRSTGLYAPELLLNRKDDIDSFELNDFDIIKYNPYSFLKGELFTQTTKQYEKAN